LIVKSLITEVLIYKTFIQQGFQNLVGQLIYLQGQKKELAGFS